MKEFLTWEGWSAVSAIAQILSLATIVVAVWRYVIQRRQMPLFAMTWDFIATADYNDDRYHVVEFRNVGRGYGEFIGFYLAEARAQLADGFLAPKTVGSNESFKLLITSDDLENAWVRLIIRTPDHRARFKLSWQPLLDEGPRADQWLRDLDAWRERSYYEVLRDRIKPRPVGPGNAPFGALRAHHTDEQIKAFFINEDDGSTFYSVLAGAATPPPLSFVPAR